MKKFYASSLMLLFLIFISGKTIAQVKSYPLFEHFTQASCGPCATQNPIFESNIASVYYPDRIHHISYHTSWPGVDPMYTANATENDARTSYYGVTGVPSMFINGPYVGGPAAVTTAMVDNALALTAPLKILVSDVSSGGTTHTVTVDAITAGSVTGSNLKMRVAVVESDKTYSSPPGSNGETYFPDVFRKMLPNTSGDAFSPAACSSATTFIYTYTMDPSWDSTKIYVVAWVQDDATKKVINSGSANNPSWYSIGCDNPMVNSPASTLNTFNLNLTNGGAIPENFRITLTSNAPAGWTSNFVVSSTTYSSTVDISVSNGAVEPITLNVTPDATPAWSEYTLEIQSLDNPSDPHEFITYTVISGITDLIVNNDVSWGDGNSYDWSGDYVSGLNAAGNTSYASTTLTKFMTAMNANALNGLYNIYFNISWTFPSFTNESVGVLQIFLDNGGNMFVAGQDIGWDTWDIANGGNGTTTTQSFYTNYLSTSFSADGGASNSQLTAVTSDAIFGAVSSSTIVDAYGGGFMYPDELTPITPAVAIFNYNSGTKIGGTRVQENGHKIVYLGVDTHMISDTNVRNDVIHISHDWFYGLVSVETFDKTMSEALGQNYPNPSSSSTIIPFMNLDNDVTLQIWDIAGRLVYEQRVATHTDNIRISTLDLLPGVYQYAIITEKGAVAVKSMEIIK